ncbi:MAG: hypothetical protein KTR15_10840 [Phycisphaeraceae bacterium]|nr:hypothetical protein [Phycisphaeraceae bacterium]
MNADTFFQHHGIDANPFAAEEARLDPIFDRLPGGATDHPDFAKIMGRIDQPATAVVFGEKGSGKTAIRLMLGKKINEHNARPDNPPVLVVAYDDLNPVLDKLLSAKRQKADAMLSKFRLEDHQDAILARAMTKLVSVMLGESDHTPEPAPKVDVSRRAVKALPKQTRTDLALLAALYDEPASGSALPRFEKLKKKLRIGWHLPQWWVLTKAIVYTAGAGALYVMRRIMDDDPAWLLPALIAAGAIAAFAWGYWLFKQFKLWSLARRATHEMPAVKRSSDVLRKMLEQFRASQLIGQPIPTPPRGGTELGDTRYQLTRRFVTALSEMGFAGMVVFIDRLDEPTLVHGDAEKMKAVAWPMFDNKFLKQERVGMKLLLPLELRYELGRESATFFQEARLDKQNLIDQLAWSGATLYDLCNKRLAACHTGDGEVPTLRSIFADDVSREMLIDGLDQMHQPRDAFKFLYAAIQEHCRLVADDEKNYKIARLTLEAVRRDQAKRVQELYRGRGPA